MNPKFSLELNAAVHSAMRTILTSFSRVPDQPPGCGVDYDWHRLCKHSASKTNSYQDPEHLCDDNKKCESSVRPSIILWPIFEPLRWLCVSTFAPGFSPASLWLAATDGPHMHLKHAKHRHHRLQAYHLHDPSA